MKFELNKTLGYAHIKRLEREGAVEELIDAFGSSQIQESSNLRGAVVIALGRISDSKALPIISDLLLSDSSDSVRRAAARALKEFGDPAALPALRVALDDESKTVQLWATQSIGRLRDRESVGRLIGMLDNPDRGFRMYAAGALGDIGDQRATEPLLGHLGDRNGTVQLAVLEALGKLGDSRAIAPMRAARDRAGWRRRRRIDAALTDLEARFG